MLFAISGSFGDETSVEASGYKVDEDGNLMLLGMGRVPKEIGRILAGEWTAILPIDPEALKEVETWSPA